MSAILFQTLLTFLIIFSCLAYASVTILPITIAETIIALMLLLWFLDMIKKRTITFVKTGLLISLILFLFFIIFQLSPFPAGLLEILSSNTARLYNEFMPGIDRGRPLSISICPNATLSELLKILAYFGIFFLVINRVETKKQFNFIFNLIIIFGIAISLFGIIQKYTYLGKVYWFEPSRSNNFSFGPFINRNNFAGYINLIIPLALGYSLTEMPLSKRIIYIFGVGIMSSALFLSLSRAGTIVYITSLLFFLCLSRLKDSLKTKSKILFAFFAFVCFISVFFIELGVVFKRLATLFNKELFASGGHGYPWVAILRIWKDFPIFGTGLGTFGNISSIYNSTALQFKFSYAHNDCLQLLSEVGVLGIILVSFFFILYFKSVIKMWLARHDSYVLCNVLGGITSTFSIMVYSFLDFNLHVPAVALLFFAIMGLVYRLVFTSFEYVKS